MDIEIKNESIVLSVCEQATNTYIPQLNGEIDSITSSLTTIKSVWSSNGIDKESYMLELEKQLRNTIVLRDAMLQLFTTIKSYTGNLKQIRKRTVDVAVGSSFSNYDVKTGHTTAADAVNDTNSVKMDGRYVNNKSSVKSFAAVNDDGSVSKISRDKGLTLEKFAKENNVSVDNVAVDIGKVGESQVWVSANDLS